MCYANETSIETNNDTCKNNVNYENKSENSIILNTYNNTTSYNGIYTTISIGNYTMNDVMIDTGSTFTVLNYNDYNYMLSHNIISEKDYICDNTMSTPSGSHTVKRYNVKSINIDNITLHNVMICFNISCPFKNLRVLGMDTINEFDTFTINFKTNEVTVTY